MQEYLQEAYTAVEATGRFDAKTRSAIIRFQEKYKEEVLGPWGLTKGTGFVGTTTRAKMNEIFEQQNIVPMHFFSEVVLKTKPGVDKEIIKHSINALTGKKPTDINRVSRHIEFSDIYVVNFDRSILSSEIIKQYKDSKYVEYIEPNFVLSLFTTTATIPNDPYYSSSTLWGKEYKDQWGLHTINAGKAWDIEKGSKDVVVAVVDTGVDMSHKDLSDNIWTNPGEIAGNGIDDDKNGHIDDVRGWDFVYNDNSPDDTYGHGTHCAGIISAVTNNGEGIAGVSWHSKIMALRIFSSGSASSYALIDALKYAADNGADVVNMSLGSGSSYTPRVIAEALDYAYAKGCVLVAASGNSGRASDSSPASYSKTISVGASTVSNNRAHFSNYGKTLDIYAPGKSILSLRAKNTSMGKIVGGEYLVASGTSMAAPFVSGAVSLIKSQYPKGSNKEVRSILKKSAQTYLVLVWAY
jgi:subtilisin family serine protease